MTDDKLHAVASNALLGMLSRGTVILIANTPDDKIIILPNGPGENGKWQAVAMLAGEGFRILFGTSFHFATGSEAVACAQEVVQAARKPTVGRRKEKWPIIYHCSCGAEWSNPFPFCPSCGKQLHAPPNPAVLARSTIGGNKT